MTDATFPAEVCNRRQFVLWRAEVRNGRVTKIPYQLNGQKASTTDPATWADFEPTVWAFVHGAARWSGFGFVFTPDDPYTGIDLDKVIDPQTGVIDDKASSIISTLNSYTEYSPSGTGVHIYVKATLPPDARNRAGNVECYSEGRYFTLTGRPFRDSPPTIAEWDGAALQQLLFPGVLEERRAITLRPIRIAPQPAMTDGDLLDAAMRASNGAAFTDLWAGGWGGHATHSEADAALCCHLAWWTDGDADRMDSLFRRSGLMRPKWDERRGARTYGGQTIAHAIALVDGGFSTATRSA